MSAILRPSFSIFALFLLIYPAKTATQDEESVPFETVVKYSTNGPRENLQTIVIKNREWRKLWNKAHAGFVSVPPRPEVDFSQRMIIAVSFEYLPNASWSFSISKIVKTEDGLRVFIKQTAHHGRFCGPVPEILVYPLHIVEAERVEKALIRNAQFEVEQQIVDCEPPK